MPQLRGEHHYAAKINAEDVRSIRTLYLPGSSTMPGIAADFGISTQQVSNIVNGKAWKHID